MRRLDTCVDGVEVGGVGVGGAEPAAPAAGEKIQIPKRVVLPVYDKCPNAILFLFARERIFVYF